MDKTNKLINNKMKYSLMNIKTLNEEIDKIDTILIKKLSHNEQYINHLNNLLESSTDKLYIIIKNLDTTSITN